MAQKQEVQVNFVVCEVHAVKLWMVVVVVTEQANFVALKEKVAAEAVLLNFGLNYETRLVDFRCKIG